MTVSSETAKVIYTGDGSTTVFSVPFYFLQKADVKVIHRAADGTETTWMEGSQYTLTGTGNQSGGTVTILTSPTNYTPAAGASLLIKRDLQLTQETDYPEGGLFPASAHENALDRATMRDQQLQEQIGRKVGFAETSTATATLPDPSAGQLLAWNGAGDDLVNVAAVDVGLTTVSAFIDTLLDVEDAATARTTLGLAIGSDVQAYDAGILKADVADELSVGFTTTVEILGSWDALVSDTLVPDLTAPHLKTALVDVNATLDVPAAGSGRCVVVATVDDTGGYTFTVVAGFETITGTFDATAGAVNYLEITRIERPDWTNSTSYAVGDEAADGEDVYICRVAHTSHASDNFATDRSNNPTYWDAGGKMTSLVITQPMA